MMVHSSLWKALLIAPLLLACKPGATITCPTLKQYSADFLSKAGEELAAIDTTAPHIAKMVNDYGVERDAIRKCIVLRSKARK